MSSSRLHLNVSSLETTVVTWFEIYHGSIDKLTIDNVQVLTSMSVLSAWYVTSVLTFMVG